MNDPVGENGADPHLTLRTAGPPRIGGVLGRYELCEVLGQGAMATVFRARDRQLGREVALKVMTLAIAARTDSAERFRREAQAVASVKHPNIVEIFDFVAAAGTEPAYIVSELIKGPTLRRFLDERRGRVLPETAALLALPLAEALEAAHTRGVVHRDLKPDNVMLERTAAGGRVVLTDFGVAHVTGLETMTATGALVGSPSYMSPEQARGDDVEPASDIFALGVLLYEMATGHLPFSGRDPLVVLGAIARGVFKRPSLVSGFVGPAFDDLCLRCLRPAPAERPAGAGALAAELRALCEKAGLEPTTALRALILDPDAFEAGLRPRVADAAVANARRHMRRGELARALAELSRATAYVPGHAEAERLVATISSRRKWAVAAAVVAGVAALGGLGYTVVPQVQALLAKRNEMAPPPAPAVVAGVLREKVPDAPPVTAPARPEPERAKPAAVRDVKSAARAEATPTPRQRRRKVAPPSQPATTTDSPASDAPTTASAAPPTREAPGIEPPPAGTVTPAAVVTPEPPPKPAPPTRVRYEISARYLFCDPGLDGAAPGRSPVAGSTTPGLHKVFCSMGGRQVLVKEMHIGPPKVGSVFRIQLRRGANGQPEVDPDPKLTSQVADAPTE